MTYLVMGANRGIGLAMCQQLAKAGQKVIAACRQSGDELDKLDVRVEENVDVTSEESLKSLADKLSGESIDVYIHNAGILKSDKLGSATKEEVMQQLEVNSVSPLIAVKYLLPLMNQPGKIALLTSRMGSIADNDSGGQYGYRASKAALNAIGKSLAIDLRDRQISVALLHPGFVKTGMTQFSGHVEPPEAAEGLLARIQELDLETTGKFWHAKGEELPW